MEVFPEFVKDYVERHNPIWENLKMVLKSNGVHNYSIFLDEDTCILYAYVELESVEKWNEIAETSVCQEWWAYMAPLMKTNENNSPVSSELKEVFHLG